MDWPRFIRLDLGTSEILLQSKSSFKRYLAITDDLCRKGIVGFTQLDMASVNVSGFANSLVITRDDFSNYQHKDRDAIDIAYGLWWAARQNGNKYELDPACDHAQIKGGQFLYGEYGWGVDFERYFLHSLCSPLK